MFRYLNIFIFLLALSGLVACGGNTQVPTGGVNVSGNWTGAFTGPNGSSAFTMLLDQSGVAVSGTLSNSGGSVSVSGSLNGTNITISGTDNSGSLTLNGNVSGNTMGGVATVQTAQGTSQLNWNANK